MRELFLAKLTQIGFDSTKYGLHSLRSSEPTAAANEGVSLTVFLSGMDVGSLNPQRTDI